MGVPKIAVIALVAIIAVPILIGYGMNLTEVTESDFRTTGESVNVTPLLQNDTGITYAHADTNKLNTQFGYNLHPIYPVYEKISSVSSSFKFSYTLYYNQSWTGASQSLTGSYYFYEQFDYDFPTSNHNASVYHMSGGVETLLLSTSGVHSIYYDRSTGFYSIAYYTSSNTFSYYQGIDLDLTKVQLNTISGTANVMVSGYNTNNYANLSAGFHFTGNSYNNWAVSLPTKTHSTLFTIDLNSITYSAYSMILKIGDGTQFIDSFVLEKTTVDGQPKWTIHNVNTPYDTIDLYYDVTKSSNTYQFYWDYEFNGKTGVNYYYSTHNEFRYVGDWPTLIGEANSYITYTRDHTMSTTGSLDGLNYLGFDCPNYNRSPKMRVDDALFKAFEYPIIRDQLYTPASFRDNPQTTIKDIQNYGTSLTFGGNTYTVSDGEITLGTRQIPLEGLKFNSVPNSLGTYDNRIGNTVVSTTAQPSTISFNGLWSADISTQSMESYTYTKTEWVPGSFGWDGMDSNFLMVGLITSIGIFIAAVIYARMSGKRGLLPLIIVTGCAAAVFFIML